MFFPEKFKDSHKAHQNKVNLINEIASRVSELFKDNPALLLSYLYRLDISEEKFRDSLDGPTPVENLAQLIYARQIERIKTKQNTIVDDSIDSNLKW